MNQRTAKAIRRNVHPYQYRAAKEAWNKIPRPQRHAMRGRMMR